MHKDLRKLTPSPPLPRKRGREQTELVARDVVHFHHNSLHSMTSQPLFNRLALIGVGLIGSSIARAARAQGVVRSIVATARSPATRRRVAELGIADQVAETNAAAVEGADLVIVSIPVGACGPVAAEIGAASQARRDRLRRRLGEGLGAAGDGAAHSRRACISCRPIRSPAPSIPAPTRALPSCSSAAGASSRRRPMPMRTRSSASPRSGGRLAPMSRPCRPSTMIWCSASPATCRT